MVDAPTAHAESLPADLASAYRQHAAFVFAVAAHKVDPSVAADITQEVFVRLWRAAGQFDARLGSLRASLVALGHKMAVEASASGAPTGARGSELADRVRRALSKLSAETRDAITVAYFGGLSYRESAVVLGVKEDVVRGRLRSALQRLRVELGETNTS